MSMQTVKNDLEASDELRFRSSEDDDVVNEYIADYTDQALQDNFSHRSLKPRRGISEAKRYAEEPILTERGYECRPVASVVSETKLMIARAKIHASEELVSRKVRKDG